MKALIFGCVRTAYFENRTLKGMTSSQIRPSVGRQYLDVLDRDPQLQLR